MLATEHASLTCPLPGARRATRRRAPVLRPAALALALASAFAAPSLWSQTAPAAAVVPLRSAVKAPVAHNLLLPTGGVAVWGQASFDTSKPNILWVTTQNGAGTQHSAINWQSFSIGAGNTTYFQQPDAASTSINRVVSNTPTSLLGSLGSNGKLVLVNQSGIAVGVGAAVDTAGFTASTLALSDVDAVSGRLRLGDAAGAGAAGITVQGQIVARQGDVVLVAPQIDTGASALVQAPNGAVVLAAGQQVQITGRGLEGIAMQVQAPSDQAVNLGTLQGGAVGMFAGTLTHSGLIQATSVSMEGGKVVLQAAGGALIQTGTIDASGSVGGSVQLSADSILSSASIKADGQAAGGQISVQAANRALATTSAQYSANAASGQGGDILVSAGVSNYSSGAYSATGATGGSVTFAGDEIKLASTRMDASGTNGGGSIHVGGLMHGAAGFGAQGTTLANANTVLANSASSFKADAGGSGHGGEVVLWSDQTLRFGGNISAQGGALGGDGGQAEVSGKTALGFNGLANLSAPHGAAGTLLLDPKNITIVAGNGTQSAGPYLEILDPTPGAGEGFGGFQNTVLPSGNIAVVSTMDSFAALNAGAVYLFTPAGALVSTVVGSSANDQVGSSGLAQFSNGNFLVRSPNWSNAQVSNAGALTWVNGATGALASGGIGGAVSMGNSLVGSTVGDAVGSGIQISGSVALALTPAWFNTTTGATYAGAVSWIDGANGHLSNASAGGAVSTANSLVGGAAWDQIGSGDIIWGLSGGNLALRSPQWGNAGNSANALGAVTWMNGATGQLSDGTSGGQVSVANSLVGATAGDKVGSLILTTVNNYATPYPDPRTSESSGISVLNGNLFINSNNWSNGANAPGAGALTWMNGASGVLADASNGGVVSGANSLVGSAAGDRVGTVTKFPGGPQTTVEANGLTDLGNGNFVVRSGEWGSGGGPNSGKGAVTWWGDNSAGVVGAVGPSNSLVGSLQGDRVGAGWVNASMNDPGVVVLPNSNYVVVSSDWGGGRGAVTWGNGQTGTTGVVSGIATAGNALSLVGTATTDHVGSQGIQVQSGGNNFVVKSPLFDFSSQTNVQADSGAITWMDGATGALSNGLLGGVVDGNNSLLGGFAGDGVGGNAQALNNGNFLAFTPTWNASKGAVTWIDGASGKLSDGSTGGAISDGSQTSANSLVGSTPYDMAGLPYQGGPLQAVTPLDNGNLIVSTPQWNNPNAVWYWDALGAVTWMNGATGKLSDGSSGGAIGASNSLVGAKTGDRIGLGYSDVSVTQLVNNNVVIQSQFWNNGTETSAGAVTWMDGSSGKLVGGATGGTVSNSNSLVGTHAYDQVGVLILPMANGNYVVDSYLWGDGSSFANQTGAVTWANGVSGAAGDVGSANSLVGAFANDNLGNPSWPNQGVEFLGNNYLVRSNWNGGMGSLTWVNGNNGQLVTGNVGEVVSASNSLVGSVAGDNVGRAGLTRLNNGAAVLASPYWGGGKGAVTWMDPSTGSLFGGAPFAGAVSASNSLVGALDDLATAGGWGDHVGLGGVTEVTDGASFSNYVVSSPDWLNVDAASAGAMTFAKGATGRVGVVSASNSLVGTLAGDRVGYGGITAVGNGNYVMSSPDWANGSAAAGAGAVTWMNGQTGALSDGSFAGAVAAANSLVGSSAGDQVGWASSYTLAGITVLGNGNVLMRSEGWNGGFSALTWMSGANGKLSDGASGGAVSASNSLLGSTVGDNLGASDFGVTELTNGNWVITTPWWSGTGVAGRGAATWMNGATGRLADGTSGGVLSSINSLTGSGLNDQVGSGYCPEGCSTPGAIALSNGNYVVNSPYWANRGAVTWGDGSNGTAGVVSLGNSAPVRDYNVAEIGNSGKVLVGGAAANGGAGGVYLIGGATASVTGWLFADSPGASASIGANSIAATLDSGSNVVLQANNDLTQDAGANISATGVGSLTLQAGRSLALHGSFNLGGAFSASASDPGALAANRDAGAAVLDAALATISASTIDMNNSGGDILTGAMTSNAGAIQLNAANSLHIGGAMSSHRGAITGTSASLTVAAGSPITSTSGVTLRTDTLTLGDTVDAGGLMLLQPLDPQRGILVVPTASAKDPLRLSLTAAEFNNITAGELQMMAPSVDFEAAVASPNINILQTGWNVTVGQPLSLTQADSMIDFNADKIDINASVSAGSKGVYLGRNGGTGPNTLAYQIGFAGAKPNLASNALELTAAELQRITTTGPLFIGDVFNAGSPILNPLQVVGPIDLTGVTGKLFLTGSSVTQTPGSTITVPQLAVVAASTIDLPEANRVSVFAASNSAPASKLVFNDAISLSLGTVAGGISNWSVSGVSATGAVRVAAPGIALNAAVTAAATGDALVLDAGAGNFSNSAGASALSAANGRWLVYSGDPASDTRGGLVYDFKQYNTAWGGAIAGANDGFIYRVNPASITPALASPIVKTYDTTTAAPSLPVLSGVASGIDGDSVNYSFSFGAATFDTPNAGSGKSVSASVLSRSVTGVSSTGKPVYGYTAAALPALTGRIDPALVNLTGSRRYDGTPIFGAAQLSIASGSVLPGDSISLSGGSAAVASANAGAYTRWASNSLVLAGPSAANYALAGGTLALDITPAPLSVSIANVIKSYDASTAAAGAALITQGSLFGNDSLVGGSFAFTDKNVGPLKTVIVSGVSVSDGNAGQNYSVTLVNNNASSITAASISAVSGITAASKVIDGNTSATLNTGGAVFAGKFAGDALNVSAATGAFVDPARGTGKVVNISGIALGGADAGNYQLLSASASTTADILDFSVWNFVDAFPRQFSSMVQRRGLLFALNDPPRASGFAADALVVEAAICPR